MTGRERYLSEMRDFRRRLFPERTDDPLALTIEARIETIAASPEWTHIEWTP